MFFESLCARADERVFVPFSTHSASAVAVSPLEAAALLVERSVEPKVPIPEVAFLDVELPALELLEVEPPELVVAELALFWPGAMVTVDPSGIVVVPLSPFGPDVTLLDIAPVGEEVLRADLASLSRLAAAFFAGVDALAEAALEEPSFAVAQARLLCRSVDVP